MDTKLRDELIEHIINTIEEQEIIDFEELHYHAFNEDYYIIGYYQASEWLEEHGIDPFDAIQTIVDYENENFGEVNTKVDNSETVVNMYVYIKGEDLLSEFDLDVEQSELLEELQEALS
ncbi:hypothetical protein KAU11_07820 [Candidatus Babeliales bacterium]|nr:hypothetical protein [Candidatus Babeliales bacterium]